MAKIEYLDFLEKILKNQSWPGSPASWQLAGEQGGNLDMFSIGLLATAPPSHIGLKTLSKPILANFGILYISPEYA